MDDTENDLRHSPLAQGGLATEFVAVCGIVALVASLALYRQPGGWWIMTIVAPMVVPAYALAVRRRDWPLLAGIAAVVASALTGWVLHEALGTPSWDMGWGMLVVMVCVWAPWPELPHRPAVVVLWVLAIAPLILLLISGGVGDFRWVDELFSGQRVGSAVYPNTLAIVSAVAVTAALALREHQDAGLPFTLQAMALVLAGAAGARVVVPALAVSAACWWLTRRQRDAWRGSVIEALPWALYGIAGAAPLLRRALVGFAGGLNQVTSNRWEIWREYGSALLQAPWSGFGLGMTDVLRGGTLGTESAPHNVPLELAVEVGIPGALLALGGLTVLAVARARRITGPTRWLFRVPVLVLLPCLALLDLPLKKPQFIFPIMLCSAALTPAMVRRPHDVDRQAEPAGAVDDGLALRAGV